MALFRVDYSGRGELSERQQKLNQMLKRLAGLSEEFNVAVFLTNQVLSLPAQTQPNPAQQLKPPTSISHHPSPCSFYVGFMFLILGPVLWRYRLGC